MMAFQTLRSKYLLLVTGTMVLIGISYIFILKPSWQKYQSTMVNYREQETRLEEIQKITNTFDSFKAKEISYIKKLNEQDEIFPNEVNSGELLFLLKQKADELKVDLTKIQAETTQEIEVSSLQINPYLVTVKGNPELIKKYIEKIQDIKRKIIITSFTIEKENFDAAGKPSAKYVGAIKLQSFNFIP